MLTEPQIQRYARHIVLPEIGGAGQARLLAARVVVVGAGGLGAPVLLNLAAAGVGTLGVIDDDVVELSNLQRQMIHGVADLGRPKTASAADAIARLDPAIAVIPIHRRLEADNAASLLAGWDLVVDGSDSFETRTAVAAACRALGLPLVSGAALRFDGQATTFLPGPDHPCWRCLHPEPPDPETLPSCVQAGVLGAVTGLIGAIQAAEAIKAILGIGRPLVGRLLLVDALDFELRTVRYAKRAGCPGCGAAPD